MTTDTQLDTRQRAYSWEDQEATRLACITQDGLAVLHAIGPAPAAATGRADAGHRTRRG